MDECKPLAGGTSRAEAEYNGQSAGGGSGGGGGGSGDDAGGAHTHTNTGAPRRKVELSGSYVDSRVAVWAATKCHFFISFLCSSSPKAPYMVSVTNPLCNFKRTDLLLKTSPTHSPPFIS